ncbi:MAG TPA: putative toxin-antitoxin system toxin component, PIN family [Nitrososphaerales archaeon]|nr:putative toxin-antitoxin system toxin component, PIN family [Nitrososphaerales archaeon]
MPSAVFDTNVLVSALIRAGKPRELWNMVLDDKVQLVTSIQLLSEFDEVVSRPQFSRYIRRTGLMRFRKILFRNARITRIRSRVDLITEDADDYAVLEAAYNGRADYIISGDAHLLKLESYRGVRIVTIDEMLEIVKRA